jgi:small subunit ribosomal protein S21
MNCKIDSFFQFKYNLSVPDGLAVSSYRGILRKGVESNLSVELYSGESQESLLKRFRKAVTQSGVLSETRRRRWFVSKSELRRKAKKKAIRRARREQRRKR